MSNIPIRRGVWLAVILLPLVMGGIQRSRMIGALSVEGGWVLRLEDEQLFLIQPQGDSSRQREAEMIRGWTINAPTIRAPSGNRFLAVDPEGKSHRVLLDRKNGEHSEWKFHIQSRVTPQRVSGGLREGDSRYTFKISVAKGPFKDWWVGVEDLPDEPSKGDSPVTGQTPRRRILKLFEDSQKAVLFKYNEASYEVHHK